MSIKAQPRTDGTGARRALSPHPQPAPPSNNEMIRGAGAPDVAETRRSRPPHPPSPTGTAVSARQTRPRDRPASPAPPHRLRPAAAARGNHEHAAPQRRLGAHICSQTATAKVGAHVDRVSQRCPSLLPLAAPTPRRAEQIIRAQCYRPVQACRQTRACPCPGSGGAVRHVRCWGAGGVSIRSQADQVQKG